MKFPVILLSCFLALTTACSSQANQSEPTGDWEEAYVKDVLFSNNPTQRTYHATYVYPVNFYIEDDCVSVTSGNEIDADERLKLYRKHDLGIVDFSRDKYIADLELMRIVSYIPRDVPRWSNGLLPFAKERRKKGEGNILCIKKKFGRFTGVDRWLIFRVTRDRRKFEALWKQPFEGNGYRSTSVKTTPDCFITVKARPDNEILETNVHIYMKDFQRATFRSKSFLGCMVRGTEAAFGLPGIVNKPDDFLLLKDFAGRIDEGGDVALPYWIPRPMMATMLYDKPGATWPEVRAEWRRLKSLKENEQ